MRPENVETSMSGHRETKSSVYAMNDQTFHTPSFGDEEFDIPLIHGQHASSGVVHVTQIQYSQMHHSAPQVTEVGIFFFLKIFLNNFNYYSRRYLFYKRNKIK
ncbi:unnamed protein product [Parnassius apollo]|uniref:(apollo) hypothetical protein n=1 Tax=Parnassius apollo TaxID=110799 RepID=A0A8S3WTH0_PARAO|nr:unnamed protein product [Parnassius apollo]